MVVMTVLVVPVVGGGGGRTVRETNVVFGGFNVGLQEFENLVGEVDSREDLVDHVDLVSRDVPSDQSSLGKSFSRGREGIFFLNLST